MMNELLTISYTAHTHTHTHTHSFVYKKMKIINQFLLVEKLLYNLSKMLSLCWYAISRVYILLYIYEIILSIIDKRWWLTWYRHREYLSNFESFIRVCYCPTIRYYAQLSIFIQILSPTTFVFYFSWTHLIINPCNLYVKFFFFSSFFLLK